MTSTPRSGSQSALRFGGYTADVASIGASLRTLRHEGRDLVVPFDADEVRPGFRGALGRPWSRGALRHRPGRRRRRRTRRGRPLAAAATAIRRSGCRGRPSACWPGLERCALQPRGNDGLVRTEVRAKAGPHRVPLPALQSAVLATPKPGQQADDLRRRLPQQAERGCSQGASARLRALRPHVLATVGADRWRWGAILFRAVRRIRQPPTLDAAGAGEGGRELAGGNRQRRLFATQGGEASPMGWRHQGIHAAPHRERKEPRATSSIPSQATRHPARSRAPRRRRRVCR